MTFAATEKPPHEHRVRLSAPAPLVWLGPARHNHGAACPRRLASGPTLAEAPLPRRVVLKELASPGSPQVQHL